MSKRSCTYKSQKSLEQMLRYQGNLEPEDTYKYVPVIEPATEYLARLNTKLAKGVYHGNLI